MGQSNRSAVEANQIPEDERVDLVVPRNGSLVIDVTLADEDEDGNETPMAIAGCNLLATCKTSYQTSHVAMLGTISARDDVAASFKITYDASTAKGLGIDVVDLVHDFVVAPTGGGAPTRIWSGLMPLSKGVG